MSWQFSPILTINSIQVQKNTYNIFAEFDPKVQRQKARKLKQF
jgi:hypothetical protein